MAFNRMRIDLERYVGIKSALSHWAGMRSIILPVRRTAEREKSATLVETVKVRHFMHTVSPFPCGKHGLAKV